MARERRKLYTSLLVCRRGSLLRGLAKEGDVCSFNFEQRRVQLAQQSERPPEKQDNDSFTFTAGPQGTLNDLLPRYPKSDSLLQLRISSFIIGNLKWLPLKSHSYRLSQAFGRLAVVR